MASSKIFNTQDLVLKVNTRNYNPELLPMADWSAFLDILCQGREYQKEAIKTAIIYLASKRYASIENLVGENYKQNDELKKRYPSEKDYFKKLQLPHKLSACVDLATATGKSYVMYGIARIALGIGLVEKVLVLGPPSLTIEKALTDKFNALTIDKQLNQAIPDSAIIANPTISNGTSTILDGTICIENINAVYAKTGSSIYDSLSFGKGSRCLVLCDEVHHAYNEVEGRSEEAISIKKWKEFLLDATYSFNYILGFTGTAYINNEYFNDVIYRYSLRQGIEDRFVKSVNYVVENVDNSENEKFQKIYQNHTKNKTKYPLLKPLTIMVTKDIRVAKQLHTRLVEFLADKEKKSEKVIADTKVIIVTSDKEHKQAVLKLPYVDTDETIEWIISVAMLTEGWDVKNVFQIVPMEEKAFNSKLLIAQVLGRGLRLPLNYPNAEVTVFNHDAWSGSIRSLVEEILEMESKIKNSPLKAGNRSQYHFTLYNINYQKNPIEVDTKETKTFNYKDYIEFIAETFEHKTETKYVTIAGKEYPVEYTIEKDKFSIAEIVNKVYDEFQIRKLEGIILKLDEREYTSGNLPTKDVIEKLIRNSMERVGMSGEYLGKSNRQAVFSTFNTLLRKKPKSVSFIKTANELNEIHTASREHESMSVLALKNDSTIFYSDDFEKEIVIEDSLIAFKEVFQDTALPRYSFHSPINPFIFKTPIDLVFTGKTPERQFVEGLIKEENAKKLTAWIKSKNQNFYSLEYAITTKAGRHTSYHQFNPDFFLLISEGGVDYIIVVEIKSDGDDSDENKAKYRYATEHFDELNNVLADKAIMQRYICHFLSPKNYSDFFTYLQDGRLIKGKFRSELEKLLLNDEVLVDE